MSSGYFTVQDVWCFFVNKKEGFLYHCYKGTVSQVLRRSLTVPTYQAVLGDGPSRTGAELVIIGRVFIVKVPTHSLALTEVVGVWSDVYPRPRCIHQIGCLVPHPNTALRRKALYAHAPDVRNKGRYHDLTLVDVAQIQYC